MPHFNRSPNRRDIEAFRLARYVVGVFPAVGSQQFEAMLAKQISVDKCAERLKAVADPDRLRVVNLLRQGPLTVGDMCERLPMELAKLSHHLGVLRTNDIVLFEKQGRHRMYRLNPEVAHDLATNSLDFGCCRLELDKAWVPLDE